MKRFIRLFCLSVLLCIFIIAKLANKAHADAGGCPSGYTSVRAHTDGNYVICDGTGMDHCCITKGFE